MLTVIDEYTRECLATAVARRLTSNDALQVLTDLFAERGLPDHIRSDNGEFTAKVVRAWLSASACARCLSNAEAHRRTGTMSRSTASCAMSC